MDRKNMFTVVESEVVGPELSEHLENRVPSTIRLAHMEFLKRKDKIEAIGNVFLSVHPAMEKRLYNLDAEDSPFKDGVIKYTAYINYSLYL
jgi:aspartate aminotransferase